MEAGYIDLLNICEDVFNNLSIKCEETQKLKKATRNQGQSELWLKYRAGRVTASRFKAAAHTDATQTL